MKRNVITFLLALVMVLGGGFLRVATVCSGPDKSIVHDYPDLKPLVDFIGEKNLSVMHFVGVKAAHRAMKDLSIKKGDLNVLALTDAGNIAKIGEYTTDKARDGVMMTSGSFAGTGNLVSVYRDYKSPLWFAFFDKKSGNCIYLEANSEIIKAHMDKEKKGDHHASEDFMKLKDEQIFTKIAKENIAVDRLFSEPEAWQKRLVAEVFGGPYGPGNEFGIVTISTAWAKGVPNDFLKAAEFHNHVCPGVTSGYIIAEYIKKNLPTKDPEKEYTFIALPPGCWDDALQRIFQSTAGAKRMFNMDLSAGQLRALPRETQGDITIVIKWERGDKHGDGLVLGFDTNKVYKGAGTDRKGFMPEAMKTSLWWTTRLKHILWMADYLEKPEELVFVIKKFTVDQPMMGRLTTVGANPLAELGIIQKD